MTSAIYARQSINKKDSISIETQIEICKKEVRDNSEVKVYTDKGFSGKNILRPAFKQLLGDIKQGTVSTVIVYRLDRISRSVVDFANIIEILNKHEVSFISANEKFDTSSPAGKAMLYIVMVFAQLERETIAERIRDNYYQRGAEGVWLGGPAPLGFNNVKIQKNGKKAATITENEDLKLVERIFNEYAFTNASLGEIAKKLVAERNEMWNNIKLSRILHNPAYVKADADVYNYYAAKGCIIKSDVSEFNGEYGLNIYGKRDRAVGKYNHLTDHHITVGMHKGIIPSHVWLKCQEKLSKNKQIKNSGKGKHTWLTGLAKCGGCGRAMVVRKYKDKKYFNCSGRALNLCDEKLSTHYVSDVEDAVFQKLKAHLENFPKYKITSAQNKNTAEINSLKIQLTKIDNEISGIINSLSSANETLIKYANTKITDLDRQRTTLLNKINDLTPKTIKLPNIPDLTNWQAKDLSFKKEVAGIFISKVSIYYDHIEVAWKY